MRQRQLRYHLQLTSIVDRVWSARTGHGANSWCCRQAHIKWSKSVIDRSSTFALVNWLGDFLLISTHLYVKSSDSTLFAFLSSSYMWVEYLISLEISTLTEILSSTWHCLFCRYIRGLICETLVMYSVAVTKMRTWKRQPFALTINPNFASSQIFREMSKDEADCNYFSFSISSNFRNVVDLDEYFRYIFSNLSRCLEHYQQMGKNFMEFFSGFWCETKLVEQ